MTLVPVVGHHDELEAELTRMVEPRRHAGGRVLAVTRDESIIAIE